MTIRQTTFGLAALMPFALLVIYSDAPQAGPSSTPPAPMATAHQPEPEKAEPTSPEPPSAPAPVPSRDHRLASALATDGATAARIIPAVLRWGGHLSDAEAYDVALSIARETRQRTLRPELVAALIDVESSYRVEAVSPTNDHGLMQLHGEPVYDIRRNIALGCTELAAWRSQYDADEREMLAHYNGGNRPPACSWEYADRILRLAEQVAH